jgi:hypothetical protein
MGMNYSKKVAAQLMFFVLLIGASCLGQKKETPEMVVARIRKQFAKLTVDSSKWRMVREDLEGRSTEGGEIKKFYRGDTLTKAVITFYGETGKSVSDYYFWDREVFFALERNSYYNKPMSVRGAKISKSEENRLYFDKQTLMRWINLKGKKVDSDLYADKEKQVLDVLKVVRP